MQLRLVLLASLGALALGACSETTVTQSVPGGSNATRTGSAQDEQACLDAVAAQANNTVTVISSEFSEANTLVMVGVGPERSPWRCLVSNGVVAEAMFAGSEGTL